MFEINHLYVSYGGIKVLKDLSLKTSEKELVTIIGANGAGKTTLINSIMGIKGVDQGKILLQGNELTHLTPWERVIRGVGLVPEGGRIFPDLSVGGNLRLGAYHRKGKSKINKSLQEVFQLFPILKERNKQIAGTLSGGEQQMLAIGRALMADPDLLLVDEISMGLMPKLVDEVFATLANLPDRGISVLLAEQNAKEALSIVNRGYVLENGKIVLADTAEKLSENEQVRKAYLGI